MLALSFCSNPDAISNASTYSPTMELDTWSPSVFNPEKMFGEGGFCDDPMEDPPGGPMRRNRKTTKHS